MVTYIFSAPIFTSNTRESQVLQSRHLSQQKESGDAAQETDELLRILQIVAMIVKWLKNTHLTSKHGKK